MRTMKRKESWRFINAFEVCDIDGLAAFAALVNKNSN